MSYVGFRAEGRLIMNGDASGYLNSLFRHVMVVRGKLDLSKVEFVSESDSIVRGCLYRAGEGFVRSSFDVSGGGLDHVVEHVLVVGYDEFFDPALCDRPARLDRFLRTASAILHEGRHVRQHAVLEKEDTELGRVFFLNQWGLYGSQAFADAIYETDVNEADARRSAAMGLFARLRRVRGFRSVVIDESDNGFSVRDLPRTRGRSADAAVLGFLRVSGMEFRSARAVRKEFDKAFMRAVWTKRTWHGAAGLYSDVDAYVAKCRDERLAMGFRASPEAFRCFKSENDGFRQMTLMAAVSTFGFGGPELQEVLFARISDKFDVDVSPESTCFRSDGSGSRMGKRIAWLAMLELRWDGFKEFWRMGRVRFCRRKRGGHCPE